MKTKDLLTKLDSLKVEDPEDKKMYITLVSFYIFFIIRITLDTKQESLQNRKLPPGMDRFLYGVSAAEGLAKSS
jgi:hypothetical protein